MTITPPRARADEIEHRALAIVRTALEDHARSLRLPPIPGADMSRMLAVAQGYLRSMPRNQLAGFSPASALLHTITTASFSAAAGGQAAPDHARFDAASMLAAGTEAQHTLFLARLRQRDAVSSSARASSLGTERLSPEIARQMDLARHEAVRLGIPWAVNAPELLRLGPAAVRAVAAVQIDQQTYNRLRQAARFEAGDVVTFANYARMRGIADARPAADSIANVIQRGQDDAEQLRIRDAYLRYMATALAAHNNPDAAAQAQHQDAITNYRRVMAPIAARSSQDQDAIRRAEELNQISEAARVTTTLEAGNTTKAAIVAVKGMDEEAKRANAGADESKTTAAKAANDTDLASLADAPSGNDAPAKQAAVKAPPATAPAAKI